MRVAAAFRFWLVFCIFTGTFALGGAGAGILEVEPDAFPEGTDLTDKFPGVILSNETLRGEPDTGVLARSGFVAGGPAPPAGTNASPTGDLVFGRESAPDSADNLIFWSGVPGAPTEISAVLRADFNLVPALTVEIDARATDNDVFELRAFDASDNEVNPPGDSTGGTNVVLPMSVTSSSPTSPEIAYVLAYGVPAQDGAGLLDNMRVEFVTVPVFIDIKPNDDRNRVNICDKGNLRVAILSFENFSGDTFFDATEVDPLTVELAGAGVRRIGKDRDKALHQMQDVNGDGLTDMIVQIVTEELGLDGEDTEAELAGNRTDSTGFVGKDAVDVQQHMCVRTFETSQ